MMLGRWRIGAIQLGIFAGVWALTLISLGFVHPAWLGMLNRLWAVGTGVYAIATSKSGGSGRHSLI
jgi:hypothetical protein